MATFYTSSQYDIGTEGKGTPLTKTNYLWFVREGFSLTKANAAVQANILAQVALGTLVPVPVLAEENKDTEDNIQRFETGAAIKNFEGKRGMVYTINPALEAQKKLRSFNGSNVAVYFGDINGNLKFTSSNGTDFQPFTLVYFNVSTQKWGAGHITHVELVLADNEEWDSKGEFFKPSAYNISSIKPVIPLTTVTQTTVAATIFTVSLHFVSNSKSDGSGVYSSVPIQGLPKENFVCYNTAAPLVPLTPSEALESSITPGSYQVTCATFTGGTFKIIPTVTNLYKSAAVTILAA